MTFTQPSGTLIMTMSLLGGRPVGGEGDGVGLAIISEKDNSRAHTQAHTHIHTQTQLATLTEKQQALRTKSALVSPTGN